MCRRSILSWKIEHIVIIEEVYKQPTKKNQDKCEIALCKYSNEEESSSQIVKISEKTVF